MKVLVTGAAGFIGFHLSKELLEKGHAVIGVDSLVPYYDVRIKQKRLQILKKYPAFAFKKISITDYKKLSALVAEEHPNELVHLAAQAGVRYSLTHPEVYADTNFLGTLNVFEAARHHKLPRVLYASSSSVYGLNKKQPFSEADRVDTPISLYAVTKKANESMAHAYHHLFGIEMLGFRFFTAYGPWGRPDMALFKFVRAGALGKPIDLYNAGKMKRNFTYVTDIVAALVAALEKPVRGRNEIYNLGGSESVPLTKFVSLIEKELGKPLARNLLPMQPGDVPASAADCSKAARDFKYKPRISIEEGIHSFVTWFKEHESFLLSLDEPNQ